MCPATRSVRVASSARISMRSLGGSPRERRAVQPRAPPRSAVHSSPRAEVVDVAEGDVAHRRALGDGDRQGEERQPRFALIEPSIGSRTTQVSPPGRTPSSSETSVKSPPSASNRATTARSTAASIAVVSSPPIPAPTTGSRSERAGSSASTPRTSSTAARQIASQSVKGQEEQPGGELRDRRTCSSGASCARPWRRPRPARRSAGGAGTRPPRHRRRRRRAPRRRTGV